MEPLTPAASAALQPTYSDPPGMADGPAFQTIFREEALRTRSPTGVDVRGDLVSFGQDFIALERQVYREKHNMMWGLREGLSLEAGGNAGSGAPGSGGAAPPGAVPGAKVGYEEPSGRTGPPMVKAVLGLPETTPTSAVNFTDQINALSNRVKGVQEAIKEAMARPAPKTPEASVRESTEINGLFRQMDTLNTQRSMMMTLHITAFQEFRSSMLIAFEHFTGSIKKVNEIFNSLKQGS